MREQKGRVAEPKQLRNDQFEIILNKSRELKDLLRELHEMAIPKIDELLGALPCEVANDSPKSPCDSWSERVINEQELATDICKELLDRMSTV